MCVIFFQFGEVERRGSWRGLGTPDILKEEIYRKAACTMEPFSADIYNRRRQLYVDFAKRVYLKSSSVDNDYNESDADEDSDCDVDLCDDDIIDKEEGKGNVRADTHHQHVKHKCKNGFLVWAADTARPDLFDNFAFVSESCSDSYDSCLIWNTSTPLKTWCAAVVAHKKGCDFKLTSLIRFLCIERGDLRAAQSSVAAQLNSFAFWPGKGHAYASIRRNQFWSENHIFLYLSSAVLFKQIAHRFHVSAPLVTNREVSLLKAYLRAHCREEFNGIYEVLSPVYAPWTMCALLNLFDFSDDVEVRNCAEHLLNRIMRQFVLNSDRNGVCLSPTCRMPRVTQHTQPWGLRINQLLLFIMGRAGHDGDMQSTTMCIHSGPSTFGDFLVTSRWIPTLQDNFPPSPSREPIPDFIAWYGYRHKERMNHAMRDTERLYHTQLLAEGLSRSEGAPFLW